MGYPPQSSKPIISQHSVGFSGSVCMFVCLCVCMFKRVCVFFEYVCNSSCLCKMTEAFKSDKNNLALHVSTIHMRLHDLSYLNC